MLLSLSDWDSGPHGARRPGGFRIMAVTQVRTRYVSEDFTPSMWQALVRIEALITSYIAFDEARTHPASTWSVIVLLSMPGRGCQKSTIRVTLPSYVENQYHFGIRSFGQVLHGIKIAAGQLASRSNGGVLFTCFRQAGKFLELRVPTLPLAVCTSPSVHDCELTCVSCSFLA